MTYYARRRGMHDYDDARHVDAIAKRHGIPTVGTRVVLNDNIDAQVYTVTDVFSHGSGMAVTLKYVSEYGKLCDAGTVDASLLIPAKLAHS